MDIEIANPSYSSRNEDSTHLNTIQVSEEKTTRSIKLEQISETQNFSDKKTTEEIEPLDVAEHNAPQEDIQRLSPLRFLAVLLALSMASFFAGYDATCVGTLAPKITDEFNSINDVSWYGIAYSLASCATILTYGKLYSFFSPRAVLASSIGIFVIGSILCATVPQSWVFVIGRAIAGLGNAGILSGGNIILTHVTSLRSRAFYLGLIGSIECIALASAPLISGAIAAVTSWRVCFYISIPCGFISMVMVFFVPKLPKGHQSCTLSAKIKQLDLFGMAIFIPTVVCFILALQWGGTIYPWRSTPVIILLILAGVMAIVFGIQQHYAGDHATIPTEILQSRIVIFGMVLMFSTSGALYIFTYYLPLYYQAVRGVSTLQSGLRDLSRILGLIIALLGAGAITSFIGYYMPTMILGSLFMCVGAGLTTTFQPTTTISRILIYQAIFGVGCGLTFQQPFTAAHVALPKTLIPAAIVIITFTQFLGSVVMLAVVQNIFSNDLVSGLVTEVPQVDPKVILNSGALSLKSLIPIQYLPKALDVYNDALVQVFIVGLAAAGVTMIGSLGSGWKSVKTQKKEISHPPPAQIPDCEGSV